MAPKRKRKNANRKPTARKNAEGYPSSLNVANLKRLGVPPGGGVEKLAANISGCIDKNVILTLLNGVPTSPKAINKAIQESVIEGVLEADIHRTWLAELDRIAINATTLADLRRAVAAYARQAGIERIDDPDRLDVYRVTGSLKRGKREVAQPAYIDKVSGRVILTGHLRYLVEDEK